MENTSVRLYGIDALRGFTVLSMVAYHFLYDVNIICGRNPLWYRLPHIYFWQQCICWSFILISGFVWPWGKEKSLRRGLTVNFWGLVITAVSGLVLPSETIWFGVLNLLGCSMLLLIPLDKLLKKGNPWLGLCLCFLLFLLFRHVDDGWLGVGTLRLSLPVWLYTSPLLTPFGFPYPGFHSSDYFPMLPWFFLYLCGYFLHGVFAAHPHWQRPLRCKLPGLHTVGCRSLLIYLLHQPLCMLVCRLIFGPL